MTQRVDLFLRGLSIVQLRSFLSNKIYTLDERRNCSRSLWPRFWIEQVHKVQFHGFKNLVSIVRRTITRPPPPPPYFANRFYLQVNPPGKRDRPCNLRERDQAGGQKPGVVPAHQNYSCLDREGCEQNAVHRCRAAAAANCFRVLHLIRHWQLLQARASQTFPTWLSPPPFPSSEQFRHPEHEQTRNTNQVVC